MAQSTWFLGFEPSLRPTRVAEKVALSFLGVSFHSSHAMFASRIEVRVVCVANHDDVEGSHASRQFTRKPFVDHSCGHIKRG